MLLAISRSKREQHALKTRPSVSVCGREVRSSIKRLAVGSQKSGKRPSALARKRGHRYLVPAVNIGTLVAIHLHRDVMLIDDRPNFGIVVRLAIHHMTPVTPDSSNIQEHRLVRRASCGKSLLAEFMPLDRLMHG